MKDVSQVSRDHGIEARAALEAPADEAPIPALIEGADFADQLKAARRAVCIPGKADPVCAELTEMSLSLGADARREPTLRARYNKLREQLKIG